MSTLSENPSRTESASEVQVLSLFTQPARVWFEPFYFLQPCFGTDHLSLRTDLCLIASATKEPCQPSSRTLAIQHFFPTVHAMRNLHYTLYREESDYVAQCLDYDVSSFGSTEKEALANLKEALELYLEDLPESTAIPQITDVTVGEFAIA